MPNRVTQPTLSSIGRAQAPEQIIRVSEATDRLSVRVQWTEGNPTHGPCYGCGQKLIGRTWRLQFRVGRKSYPRKQPEIICDACLEIYQAGIGVLADSHRETKQTEEIKPI